MSGHVECDASIMEGKSGAFGAVGCLPGVKNPICVAYDLMLEERKGLLNFGLIPPMLLCGRAAWMYARDRGLGEPCNEEELGEYLVTETSRLKHKNCLSLLSGKADCPLEEPDSLAENELDVMMDTVGVICRDRNGNVSAGVSSGGILLKRPGRVGEAAMFGCGCYALNLASQSNAAKESAACGVSGCGEHVMKTRLAEKCCSSAFLNSSDGRKGGLYDSLRVTLQDFLDHPWLSHIPQRLCGLVVLHEYVNGIEIAWGHTSASFAVGYFREGDCKPTALVSRLPKSSQVGNSFLIGGTFTRRDTLKP